MSEIFVAVIDAGLIIAFSIPINNELVQYLIDFTLTLPGTYSNASNDNKAKIISVIVIIFFFIFNPYQFKTVVTIIGFIILITFPPKVIFSTTSI